MKTQLTQEFKNLVLEEAQKLEIFYKNNNITPTREEWDIVMESIIINSLNKGSK